MSERTAKTVKRSKSSEAEGARLDSEANRNRVVGSIFLISLAVIVLPMIFDGDGLARPDLPPMSADFEAPAEREITPPPPIPEIVEEQIAKLDEEVDEEGFDRSNGTLVGEPVLSEPNAQSDVYAVQVASFAAQEKRAEVSQPAARGGLRSVSFDAPCWRDGDVSGRSWAAVRH